MIRIMYEGVDLITIKNFLTAPHEFYMYGIRDIPSLAWIVEISLDRKDLAEN